MAEQDMGLLNKEVADPTPEIASNAMTDVDKLQIQKLGTDYQFKVVIPLKDKQETEVELTSHILSLEEEIKASCKSRELTSGGIPVDKYSLFLINAIATLDVCTDGIVVKDKKGFNKKFDKSFWEFVRKAKNFDVLLETLVFPYTAVYNKVKTELQIGVEDLKNF